MSYNIIPTRRFERELKRLAKKYPSIRNEFAELIGKIIHNPLTDSFIGYNCYKIRMAITSVMSTVTFCIVFVSLRSNLLDLQIASQARNDVKIALT